MGGQGEVCSGGFGHRILPYANCCPSRSGKHNGYIAAPSDGLIFSNDHSWLTVSILFLESREPPIGWQYAIEDCRFWIQQLLRSWREFRHILWLASIRGSRCSPLSLSCSLICTKYPSILDRTILPITTVSLSRL